MKIKISEEKDKQYFYDKEWKKKFAILPTIAIEKLSPEFKCMFLIWFEWYFVWKGDKYLKRPT